MHSRVKLLLSYNTLDKKKTVHAYRDDELNNLAILHNVCFQAVQ